MSFVGRDGLQISAQPSKAVLFDMLVERVDLSDERAGDIPPRATELLALLEGVRDEAGEPADEPTGDCTGNLRPW